MSFVCLCWSQMTEGTDTGARRVSNWRSPRCSCSLVLPHHCTEESEAQGNSVAFAKCGTRVGCQWESYMVNRTNTHGYRAQRLCFLKPCVKFKDVFIHLAALNQEQYRYRKPKEECLATACICFVCYLFILFCFTCPLIALNPDCAIAFC